MKFFLTSVLFLITTSSYSQEYNPIYRKGLNSNGSYYSRGSSNYKSGTYVNGNFFGKAYTPQTLNPNYFRYKNYYNTNNNYIYAPPPIYWWHDRLR